MTDTVALPRGSDAASGEPRFFISTPYLPPGVLADVAINVLLWCWDETQQNQREHLGQHSSTRALLAAVLAHLDAQRPDTAAQPRPDLPRGVHLARAGDLRITLILRSLCAAVRTFPMDPVRAIGLLRYAHEALAGPYWTPDQTPDRSLVARTEVELDRSLLSALWFVGDLFLVDPPQTVKSGQQEALTRWGAVTLQNLKYQWALMDYYDDQFDDPLPYLQRWLCSLGSLLSQRGLDADERTCASLHALSAFCLEVTARRAAEVELPQD